MIRDLRRTAATFALPLVLALPLSACHKDDAQKEPEAAASSAASGEKSASTKPKAAETQQPTLADVPNPRKDPDAFRDYMVDNFVKSGMTEKKANCVADAIFDNTTIKKLTGRKAAKLASNKKIVAALKKCE